MSINPFRPAYRELSSAEKVDLEAIKAGAYVLLSKIRKTSRDPRYTALATTALEEAVMWAVKGITA